MTWNPKRRYSAVAVMSEDLGRVVLIHKLKPDWQAGKANLPGGKVDTDDVPVRKGMAAQQQLTSDHIDTAYRNCARRELCEETGLDVVATALQLFCRLRFKSREGDDAECCFYAVRGDVDAARTMEAERVFVGSMNEVVCDGQTRTYMEHPDGILRLTPIPTMPNLPYLVAMARQCLRGESGAAWPLTIYENGATL